MVTIKPTTVPYKELSWEEASYLMTATKKLLDKQGIDLDVDPRIKETLARIITAIPLVNATEDKTVAPAVKSLSELDRERDMDVQDFKAYVKSQLRHRNPTRRLAAEFLNDLILSFGNLTRLSQSEQSAAIIQLLTKLEEKEVRAKVNAIGAGDFYTNIKESQEKFEAAYLKKLEGRSKPKELTKTDQRRQVIKTYKTLYRYLLCLEELGIDSYHKPILIAFNDVRQTILDKLNKKKASEKKELKAPKTAATSTSSENSLYN